ADGSLSASDRGTIEAHVAGCPDCREALEALREVPAIVRHNPGEPEPDDAFFLQQRREIMRSVRMVDEAVARERQRGRWRTGITAMAAGVVAAIGVWTAVPPTVVVTGGDYTPDPTRLARLEVAGLLGDGDTLLVSRGKEAPDPLDEDERDTLEDLLGTV